MDDEETRIPDMWVKKIRFRENIIINLEKKVIWIFFLLVDFSKSIILSKTRQLGRKSVVFVQNLRFWKVHILELNPEKTQLEKTKLEKTGKVTLASKNWWMGRFQTLYPRKQFWKTKLNILKFGFSRTIFNNLYIKAEFESKLRNYEGRDSNEIQIKTKYTF